MVNIIDAMRGATRVGRAAQTARILAGIARQMAGNTQDYQPSGSTGGGGGGVSAAPVSTLAGIPQSPLLTELMGKGLIKEGMAPEQALAILQLGQMRGGVPIDIKALMDEIKGNYETYTGDILTAGQEWMKDLYGTAYDPNDPNAAMFAQDPIFSSYAGGLAQMDETADQNLATDLAWFTKQQQMDQAYYDQMMTGIATGTIPAGPVANGGGGGGGGGRRGGYGGGGGSSGDNALGFGDVRTTGTITDTNTEEAKQMYYENHPGFIIDTLTSLASNPAVAGNPELLSELTNEVEFILDTNQDPMQAQAALAERIRELDTDIEDYLDIEQGNREWEAQAPGEWQGLLNQLTEGQYTQGDVLGTEAVEPTSTQFALPIEAMADPRFTALSPEQQAELADTAGFVNEAVASRLGGRHYNLDPIAAFMANVPRMQQLARNYLGSEASQPVDTSGPGQPPSGGYPHPTTNAEINTSLDMAANSGNPFTPNFELPENTDTRFPIGEVLAKIANRPQPPEDQNAALDIAASSGSPFAPNFSLPTNPYDVLSSASTSQESSTTPPPVTILDGQGQPQPNPEFAEWAQQNQERIAEGQAPSPPIEGTPPGGMDLVPGIGLGASFTSGPLANILQQFRTEAPQPPEPTPDDVGNIARSIVIARLANAARQQATRPEQSFAEYGAEHWGDVEDTPLATLTGSGAELTPNNLLNALMGKVSYGSEGQLTTPIRNRLAQRSSTQYEDWAKEWPSLEQAENAVYGMPHYQAQFDSPEQHASNLGMVDALYAVKQAVAADNPNVAANPVYNRFSETQKGQDVLKRTAYSFDPPAANAFAEPGMGDEETALLEDILAGAPAETELDEVPMGYAGQSLALPAGARPMSAIGTRNPSTDISKLLAGNADLQRRKAQAAVQQAAANRVGRTSTVTPRQRQDVDKAVQAVLNVRNLLGAFKKARR